MKKILILSIVALSVFVAGFAFATVAGSAHDLETATGVPLCQSCHHPHTGQDSSANILWNLNGGQDDTAYTTYGNGSIADTSAFESWACMSCHDGSFATSTLFKGGNGAVTVTLTYGDLIEASGIELQNDHPVAVALDTAVLTGYQVPTAGALLYPGNVDGDNVECASCHDVHNSSLSLDVPMLRVSQTSSALCTDCHVK